MKLVWISLLILIGTSCANPQDQSERVKEREALYQVGLKSLFHDINITIAVEAFNKSSSLGHSDAQFYMGVLYSNGIGVPTSNAKAILYFTFSAMSGNMNAQLALASRSFYGHSVPKQCKDSERYSRKVADNIAKIYREASVLPHVDKIRLDDDSALSKRATEEDVIEYYKYNADRGDTSSQMIVGRCYMYGHRGLEQNGHLAADYFLKAAEAGEPAGYGSLGQLYTQGVSGGESPVERDYDKAFEYFKKGSEKGHPVSQNGMGLMYISGRGVEVNYTEAVRYFRLAADARNPEALYNLGVLYLNGEGVGKDPKKAIDYLQLASQNGQLLAHYELGNIYADGTSANPSNCVMAVKYYRGVFDKAPGVNRFEEAHSAYLSAEYHTAFMNYLITAELGYEIGQSNVAYMLDQLIGLDDIVDHLHPLNPLHNPKPTYEDHYRERALLWLKRSAEQNNIDAIIKAGDYYYYGMGTKQDIGKSVEYYRDAAERSNPQALFNLGYMHQHGLSIPRDFHLAKRYYDLAGQHDQAWAPVQLALLHLNFQKFWGKQILPEEEITLFGAPLEDALLALLVGLLGFLLVLRHTARQHNRH